MFYKMQIVHDHGRDVYILWNRWGRIGEDGASQRTPFGSLEQATNEFKKIFKSKSGNVWDERQSNIKNLNIDFEQKPTKYLLLKFKSTHALHSDFLLNFDYSKIPNSLLSKEVRSLMKEITNRSIYAKALNESGIDTELLNLTYLNKELIHVARKYLGEIKVAFEEIDTIGKKAQNEGRILTEIEVTRVLKLKSEVIQFTNRYYECIPKASFHQTAIKPIDNVTILNQEIMILDNLNYVENAVKILLAALYRQYEINPLHYVLDAINIKVQVLPKETNEYGMLNKYICNSKQANLTIMNIFKVEKKGELETIEKWSKAPNHYLLFHGTKVFNYIGILSQV